ncbi:hypothetical protein NJC40_06745 [Pseudomonas sp. 21LCFQ02]|uniref:dermonecrotic toxin domain-containing protein n=1 Tax=Pseudomonas sp. 21LCFQ02 TaxID=2957505 RepID=UPI00209A74AC|nr:DUF6543 domain-containing protein [Pseudomonas sp. 21LCFQ02]MCO8167470.1 hypothetical protein [Pseudomonas sp. 21LCFQ02]
MSLTPYFHPEPLRQRFMQHVQAAQAAQRIDADQAHWLQRFSDVEQPLLSDDPPVLHRLILEDGSPVPLALASAILIVHRSATGETLYLDSLAHGLECFTERSQLASWLRQRFAIRSELNPEFEYQVLEGSLFEQRMLLIVDHQVQALNGLLAMLQKLPSLQQAIGRMLKPRLQAIWPAAAIDPQALTVQIVETDPGKSGADAQTIVRVLPPEQAVLGLLAGDALPDNQQLRFLDRHGEELGSLADAQFKWQLNELIRDYEALLADYWAIADEQRVSRRERVAQRLADGFTHQVLALLALSPTDTQVLLKLGSQALGAEPAVAIKRLSLSAAQQGPFKLVSLYLVHLEGGYALYSPGKGLRLVGNWQALMQLANSPAGRSELRDYLSLDDQRLFTSGDALQLHSHDLAQPLFLDCIDSIIGLQKRNLNEVLKRQSDDAGELLAMVDDALDVRTLIDPRLSGLEPGGRWQAIPARFLDIWSNPPEPVAWPYGLTPSWMEQVTLHDTLLKEVDKLRPRLEALARQALNPWLAVVGGAKPLDAQQIRVRGTGSSLLDPDSDQDDTQPDSTARPLTDLLLERLTGLRNTPLADNCEVLGQGQPPEVLASITPGLLEHVLAQAGVQLLALSAGSVSAFFDRPLRQDHAQSVPGQMMGALHYNLLRLELQVARRLGQFPQAALDMLQQVLDRPGRDLRLVHGNKLVEVHAVHLQVEGRRISLGLSDAWVMQCSAHPDQGLLFWSRLSGLQAMSSLASLQVWLQRHLVLPDWRARWLELFEAADQAWLDQSMAAGKEVHLSLLEVDGHFIDRLQAAEQQRQQQALGRAIALVRQSRLPAETCRRHIDLVLTSQRQGAWLDTVAIRIQNLLFAAVLPDWLHKAADADLELYVHLLEDFYGNGNPADDFLADIPMLRPFAREQLLAALSRDFPAQVLDPHDIRVTMTRYVAAPVPPGSIPSAIPAATVVDSENLVSFSLNHFARIQDASLSVSMAIGGTLPMGLTAEYVTSLVHRLDIGKRYQALLSSHFDPGRADYAARRLKFMRQIPARLLLPALELKLQGELSQQAFDFIARVIDMPDGKARQPLHRQTVVLRPLTLVPRADMAPDEVEGAWLIGPLDSRQGPVVLHTLFNDKFTFKEFRDQDQLLSQLRTAGPLQTLVLERLKPAARTRYDNGGLTEAHVIPWSIGGFLEPPLGTPGKVSIGSSIVEGNALRYLFKATLQLLQDLSHKQAVTSAQADWASFVHVLTLGGEQILLFLPGRLGLLVGAWQSQNLLRESAGALAEQHWGKALSEFSAALGMLVMTRREQVEVSRARPHVRLPEFSWRHSSLGNDIRLRLAQLEVHDIELADLNYDALYNLYQDPGTRLRYAAVAGKVYEVHQQDGVWRIKGGDGNGPKLRLSSNQQWELSLELGLRGGAPSLVVSSEQQMQHRVAQIINVQARGMDQIRALSRDQARFISLARQRALGYLENALFNLNAPFAEGLPLPVQTLLGEFFGVTTPGTVLIDMLRQRISQLFVALSEPSLSPLDSVRFVTGTVRPGYENMAAFVITSDPLQRLYLSDMFFTPPVYILKSASGIRAFNPDDHFRAVTLLHELSHLVCRTQDIAYLDAVAPPLDLLDDSLSLSVDYKQELQLLREASLSHQTPLANLFRTWDSNGWRDFQPSDGSVFATILKLAGQPDLTQARRAFLTDVHVRRRVILSNADSLALLVAQLGLERFT